jgi:hypothetical protein
MILREKLDIINWHINSSEKNQQSLSIGSRKVPSNCKLNQQKLESLIEDCNFLVMQAKSILSYDDNDL